ncbi:MAG: hypothetical protein K1X78_14785 [Verrucomicrobiaceae bacterium]|nr:hypothetical protein [Verrucomicrobiaceae bacterium]
MNTMCRTLIVLLAGVVAAGAVFLLLRAAPTATSKQTGGAKETEEALKAMWDQVLTATPDDKPAKRKRQWQMQLTTWLPEEWPPSRRTTWVRYAWGIDVSMDGSSDVSAPFARIECRGGDVAHQSLTQTATRLKVVAVHPVRPHGGWRYTLEDEKHMVDQVLALRTAPPADSRSGIGIKSYFQSWKLGHEEIAAQVENQHRAFFDWLKAPR